MRIHISTKPLHQASQVRGVGVYTRQLVDALTKNFPDDKYYLTDRPNTQVDLVHYPYFEPFFLTLGAYHSTPFVVTVHDLIPLKYPFAFPPGLRGKLKWQLQKLLVRKSAHIITDSSASGTDIQTILQIPEDRLSVVPLAPSLGVATKEIKQAAKLKYRLPKSFALYVGDINWNKNIPGLIREYSSLPNSSLHLFLVGQAFTSTSTTPEALAIQKAVSQSGKADKIHLLGFLSPADLASLYSLATIYIQPSWDEGFGLPVLEAMAAGCPVLCSNRGSLREVGGEAVSYFDPAMLGDLAARLSELINSPARRQKLIIQGKKHIKQYSWDKTAELTHAVYEKVLGDY